MEGESQQSLFATRFHFHRDVEEHRGRCVAGLQDLDAAWLFDDEHAIAPFRGVGDEERACQSTDDRIEAQTGRLRGRGRRKRHQKQQCDDEVRA